MYNLNVNVTAAGQLQPATATSAVNNLLAVEQASTTPRTPEILNTLIAMTNPLDSYNFTTTDTKSEQSPTTISKAFLINNESSNSSIGCGGGIGESPTSPPSVQHTCSQLIKAGLKLSIQSKRKLSGGDSSNSASDILDLDSVKRRKIKGEITCSEDEYEQAPPPTQGLTPEDEERRRRRRERNKIAATKCRLKKREKTVNLVHESETLETQNIELKTQIQQLESQRRQLVDMLSMHSSACIKNEPIDNTEHHQQYDNASYFTDTDVTTTATTTTSSTSTYAPFTFDTTTSSSYDEYNKPLIILSDDNNTTQLIDLDSPNSLFQFNATAQNAQIAPQV